MQRSCKTSVSPSLAHAGLRQATAVCCESRAGRIALVEQGELQWPGVTGECGDLRCPEAAESVEPGWNQFLAPRDALDMFCAMLGGFAGNVALTYGARGGVYIAGGIAPRILDHLAVSEFRSRFVQKGRFQAYLEAIPSQVIVHPAATFLGLMSLSGTISP